MMRFVVLLLLTALLAGASGDEPRVYVGELRAASRGSLELNRNGSIISIGFVGDPVALAGLDGLRVGEEVRAVFGFAPRPGGNGRINKLLSIRRCERSDAQCAADGRAQDAEDAEREKAHALRQEERAQCHREMEKTLLADTPVAPTSNELSQTLFQDVSRQFNSLTGHRRDCADAFLRDRRAAVLQACELHHCGDGIAGGCTHIAHNSTSEDIARALVACKDK